MSSTDPILAPLASRATDATSRSAGKTVIIRVSDSNRPKESVGTRSIAAYVAVIAKAYSAWSGLMSAGAGPDIGEPEK